MVRHRAVRPMRASLQLRRTERRFEWRANLMAFYVSAHPEHRSPRAGYVLCFGPYNTHGAALAHVEAVRRFARRNFKDGDRGAFGTCRRTTDRPAGRLNDLLGYTGPGGLP